MQASEAAGGAVPYYRSPSGDVVLWQGDAAAVLRALPAGSVHTVITSPPYWNLRDYQTGGWEGGDPDCGHGVRRWDGPKQTQGAQSGHAGAADKLARAVCGKCGARRVDAQLGLEDSPDAYVAALVAVFREVWRVLHPTGCVWPNIGDSYTSSPPGNKGNGVERYRSSGLHNGAITEHYAKTLDASVSQKQDTSRAAGLAPKQLLMMPSRVALALQADGWWLRSMIPYLKRSAMPESTTDRPSTATEYIFLLAKSGSPTFWTHRDLAGSTARPAPDYRWVDPADPRRESREPVPGWKRVNLWAGHDYFYDADAGRLPHAMSSWSAAGDARGTTRKGRHEPTPKGVAMLDRAPSGGMRGDAYPEGGRNRRNADWWFDSLRAILDGATGLLADEDGAPLALPVNPAAYPGAHFATFAPKLVEPMVLASTSAKGCCPACGAPWVRVVSSATGGAIGRTWTTHEHADDAGQGNAKLGGWSCRDYRPGQTTGWRAGCGCDAGDPIPAVVLDPFCGSGTVSLVARKHGRHSWGIDLSAAYLELARERLGQLALPGLVAD